MEEKKTEGLLLQTIPYLSHQKILKILTSDAGLITLLAKNKSLQPFTQPFLIAEWVYTIGKGEIHTLKDASLCQDLSELRESYSVISAAGLIAQDLLKSQCPEKNGRGPYALAVAYFQKLPKSLSLEAMIASFRLKLLLHDGLLGLQNECVHCGAPALSLDEGGSYCHIHRSPHSTPFSVQEWELLHEITFARQFQSLQNIKIEQSLQKKIEQLFYSLYRA
jgi:DNA repair protein RecO